MEININQILREPCPTWFSFAMACYWVVVVVLMMVLPTVFTQIADTNSFDYNAPNDLLQASGILYSLDNYLILFFGWYVLITFAIGCYDMYVYHKRRLEHEVTQNV